MSRDQGYVAGGVQRRGPGDREKKNSFIPALRGGRGFARPGLSWRYHPHMFRLQHAVLDDPPRNVLSIERITALEHQLFSLATDDTDAIVLSSRLTWGFSAGVDLNDHTPDRIRPMLTAMHGLIRKLVELPCLLIAQVHGPCLGGAAELVLMCDGVIAADDATFGFPEIKVGCFPPIAVALLASRIGMPRAVDLVLSGRSFSAEEALAMGLINQVVPRGEKEETVLAYVEGLCGETSRATRRHTLLAMRRLSSYGWLTSLEASEQAYLALPPQDLSEGIAAFLEKRPAVWKNG